MHNIAGADLRNYGWGSSLCKQGCRAGGGYGRGFNFLQHREGGHVEEN